MKDNFVISAYPYFCPPLNLPFANFVCLVPDHRGSGTRWAGAPAAPSIQSRTAYWCHVYGELKKGAGTPGARIRKWLPQRFLGIKFKQARRPLALYLTHSNNGKGSSWKTAENQHQHCISKTIGSTNMFSSSSFTPREAHGKARSLHDCCFAWKLFDVY